MNSTKNSSSHIQEQQGQSYLKNEQKQSNNQNNISLTLEIQDFKLITEEPKSKKYKDLLSSLKRDYFKELSRENELILAQGWNPVIPQSFDSKIDEVLNYTVPRYTVWKLNDYLLEMAHRQNELSETITKCQDQIAKDTWKIQYQELEPKYNEIYEQYNLLKKYCQKYFEAIDQIKVIKDNSIIVQPINQQSRIIQKDLRKEYSNQQESIQEQNLLFIQEYFVFKKQITQLKGKLEQIPIQQGFNKPEIEQSQNKKSNPKIKIQEVTYDSGQKEFHQSKESKIDNSDITSICGQCKKSCPEHIVLPCKQRYHEHCFEQLGRQSYVDSQPSVYCICQNKISIKLFKKETQFLLLSHQAALIFKNYHNTFPFSKCKDCEFYYKFQGSTHDSGKAYCPNCLKFIRGS